MNQELSVFLTPLVLLPGVALLVMSTSARYAQLHGEFHHLEGSPRCEALARSRVLLRRGRLFWRALVSLYATVSLLALASLVGGVLRFAGRDAAGVVLALTCAAILTLFFAAVELVRESTLSFQVLCDHAEDIEREHSG